MGGEIPLVSSCSRVVLTVLSSRFRWLPARRGAEERVALEDETGIGLRVGERAERVVDRLHVEDVSAIFEQRQDVVARDIPVDLQDELGPVPVEEASHAAEGIEFHALHVDLDAVDDGVAAGDAVPDRVQADGNDPDHLESPIGGQLRVDHPALGREPRDNRPRCFGQGEGDGDELVESIDPGRALEASRRGQDRFKCEDPALSPTARAMARLV